jgi:hypothetical protein
MLSPKNSLSKMHPKSSSTVFTLVKEVSPMELEDEIVARMRAAKSLDKETKPGDFQIRVAENGSVLVNLKTGRAQLLYDDDSKLHDLEDLKINAAR